MIPKVIHYCWFGRNPLPPLALKCIESWKKYLPDYEIKEWNEYNFDVCMIPYTKEAYEAKKYAFVSDYARFWILYHYGGLYFDTDVELIKNMDAIISKGSFMGCENEASDTSVASVAPGLGLGVNPGLSLYKEMLDLYKELNFTYPDGSYNQKTIVAYTTEILVNHGLKKTNEIHQCAEIWIYPKEYFCPKSTNSDKISLTSNTVSIHHFDGSWWSPEERYANELKTKLSFIKNPIVRGHLSAFIASIRFHGIIHSLKRLKSRYKFF